ncbi:retinoic acid receptor responder protein 2-like isoform X2 [Hemicordylus capensis]|uniref:retinoic acid receptor responder protein 2-like isoform X2 n=1 Tax=Hemicordylus capensis TaxID=884348 RepID=UPI0023026869|nr:retinoic acid receptor responder protein 2-like isoform X2 [Hemicordylus capensis]
MEGLLLCAIVASLGVAGTAAPSVEVPVTLAPLDVARIAVETYNHGTGTQAVFKLLKLRNTHKTRFSWGTHFSLNFTIKETTCRKTSNYRIEDCRYKPNGRGHSSSNKKPNSNPRPQAARALPEVHVEYYLPSSFSTAALMAIEEE